MTYRVAVLTFLVLILNVSSHAEVSQLDSASIRVFYDEITRAVGDAERSRSLMEERLADRYLLETNLTQVLGDNPQVATQSSFDKRQVISNALRGYSIMHVDHYMKKIIDIRFSADHIFAYVTTTTASSGSIDVPTERTNSSKTRYEDGEGCIDQLTLTDTKIRLLRSVCNEKFVVKK